MITASLCSIPDREENLKAVVSALRPQVDRMRVFLNGHREIPEFLRGLGISIESDSTGALGDARKFHWADKVRGIHLVCDDDLAYPDDYAAAMTGALREYGWIVGVHGCLLKDSVKDYRRDAHRLHFSSGLGDATRVHILGTGTLAYRSDTIQVSPQDFPEHGIADLLFAGLAQDQEIPMTAIPREAGWLTQQPTKGGSIFGDSSVGRRSTVVVRRRTWRIF